MSEEEKAALKVIRLPSEADDRSDLFGDYGADPAEHSGGNGCGQADTCT